MRLWRIMPLLLILQLDTNQEMVAWVAGDILHKAVKCGSIVPALSLGYRQ